MVTHVRFGTVQQPFEFEPVGVTVRNHIAHLADDGGKDEHTDQVADDREDVSDGKW